MKEGIDMIDSFDDVLKARRSTREYTEEGVSKEDMQQIVEAGTLAPSGMGRNELMFVGLTNEYAKEYLSIAKNKFGMDRYYGAKHIILVSFGCWCCYGKHVAQSYKLRTSILLDSCC